ncbi:MAG: hypothetical protein ACO2PM_10950 [Pyrobaculum sp.]|jgi:hypothetical protein
MTVISLLGGAGPRDMAFWTILGAVPGMTTMELFIDVAGVFVDVWADSSAAAINRAVVTGTVRRWVCLK